MSWQFQDQPANWRMDKQHVNWLNEFFFSSEFHYTTDVENLIEICQDINVGPILDASSFKYAKC